MSNDEKYRASTATIMRYIERYEEVIEARFNKFTDDLVHEIQQDLIDIRRDW